MTPCTIGLDFGALIAQKDELVHTYRKVKDESLVGNGIRLDPGHVQFVDAHTVEADGKRLKGDKLLIATGSRPIVPDIEGLDSVSCVERYGAQGEYQRGVIQRAAR